MSRIHEALKKAELERQRRGDVPPAVLESSEPVALTQDVAFPIEESHFASPLPQLSDVSARELTFEMLLARCRQEPWIPKSEVLFWKSENHMLGSEEFRTLRSRLYQMRSRQAMKSVLVSSALPGEGKTYVSVNLAQAIVRQPEKRALLIDADLRQPRVNFLLGAHPGPGLTDYLRGAADEFSILQRGSAENLFFIPGGKPVANPIELISNGKLPLLLQRLKPIFDWIVVDSPPAVPISDASLLADMCDGVLLVVRAGTAPLDVLQKAREEFRKKRLLGVALNRVDPNSTYSKYYYGYQSKATDDKG